VSLRAADYALCVPVGVGETSPTHAMGREEVFPHMPCGGKKFLRTCHEEGRSSPAHAMRRGELAPPMHGICMAYAMRVSTLGHGAVLCNGASWWLHCAAVCCAC